MDIAKQTINLSNRANAKKNLCQSCEERDAIKYCLNCTHKYCEDCIKTHEILNF